MSLRTVTMVTFDDDRDVVSFHVAAISDVTTRAVLRHVVGMAAIILVLQSLGFRHPA